MAATANPYGLYVRKCAGARRNTAGNTHYPVTANVTGACYYGAPVTFVTAGVGPVAASPSSAAPVLGVVQGAQWTSAMKPEWFPSLPANTFSAGGKQIEVMVNDDPSLVMMVQATATLDLTAVGKVGALVNFATGNNQTGRSICALDAASLTATGDKAVRVIGVLDPGAAFPDVLVQWNNNVHALQASATVEPLANDAVDPEEQQRIFEEFVRDRINEVRDEAGLPLLLSPEDERERRIDEQRQKQEDRKKRLEEHKAEVVKNKAERDKRMAEYAKADAKTDVKRVETKPAPELTGPRKGDK